MFALIAGLRKENFPKFVPPPPPALVDEGEPADMESARTESG
jgi:hypothetical protein